MSHRAGRLSFLRMLAAGMGLSFAVLVSIPPFTALAATVITVTDNTDPFPPTGTCPGPNCTLRGAIAAALAGDTIDVPSSLGSIILSPANGPLVVSQPITIQSTGGGTVAIDGANQTAVLINKAGGANSTSLSGLTIQHGSTARLGIGGGITNTGVLVLNNVVVANNTAVDGAGILDTGTLSFSAGSVSDNVGSGPGGDGAGVSVTGTFTATGTSFTGNKGIVAGGGIFVSPTGSANLSGVTVSGNLDALLGAGLAVEGVAVVDRSTIRDNTTGTTSSCSPLLVCEGGGAIFAGSGSVVALTNSTVAGNSSGPGGGISAVGSSAVGLTSDTITGNSAGIGGGIFRNMLLKQASTLAELNNRLGKLPATQSTKQVRPAQKLAIGLALDSVTLAGNTAATGGGVSNSGPDFNVHDTINALNTATAAGADCSGTVTSQGYNLESSTDCAFTATGDQQNTSPKLGPLSGNGGPTQTMALLSSSPALDAGDPACPAAGTDEGTDQRGVTRPQGSACDIGAFELFPATTPTPVPTPPMPVPGPPATGQPATQPGWPVAAVLLGFVTALLLAASRTAYRTGLFGVASGARERGGPAASDA